MRAWIVAGDQGDPHFSGREEQVGAPKSCSDNSMVLGRLTEGFLKVLTYAAYIRGKAHTNLRR